MRLPLRLAAIADWTKGGSVADIGTDHALLPVFLVLSEKAEKAFACDIGTGPLEAARRQIEKAGVGDRVQPVLGDGIPPCAAGCDCLVIAGMGGELIAAILSRHSPRPGQQLLLQPMTREGALRRALHAGGWRISREAHIREDERIYTLIEAFAGKEEPPYRPAEEEVGRFCREGAGREKLLRRLAEETRVAESRRAAGREDRILEEWIREWEAMV